MSDLIRRDDRRPLDLLTQMRREMDDMFSGWFGRNAPAFPSNFGLSKFPSTEQLFAPLDIHETDGEYIVKMDAPGMAEKDFKVSCQGDVLTIQGERKEEKVEGKGERRYSERSYGMFTRTLNIPVHVKQETIRARYKDGVMEVHLPKAEKTPVRDVKVETAG